MNNPKGHQTMSSALPEARNYHRWILDRLRRRLRRGGTLLEIGPGYGQYTPELAGMAHRLVAVDCDAQVFGEGAIWPENVELKVADLGDPGFPASVGEAAFDQVVCLNVLEHLEDDVEALRRISAALRPGGDLLLLVPAHPGLYGPMDRLAGHFRRYTRRELGKKLAAAGFEILENHYFNPLGGLGWWFNARCLRPRELSDDIVNRQILFFDRFVQPASRLFDPLTRGFFGQSLWAVARKPKGSRAQGGDV